MVRGSESKSEKRKAQCRGFHAILAAFPIAESDVRGHDPLCPDLPLGREEQHVDEHDQGERQQ